MKAGNARLHTVTRAVCALFVLLSTPACSSQQSARGDRSDRAKAHEEPAASALIDEAPPRSAGAVPPLAGGKPILVKGALPVAPFVAEQQLSAPALRTVVYVGASWCEPCQRFHAALAAGELDAALRGVRFIEYDSDAAKDALAADGYRSRLIPLFALPAADGRASAHAISGSIKGAGAVDNIMPRLKELLATGRNF